MRRKSLLTVATVAVMILGVVPVSARPPERSAQPAAAQHADLDNDGLSRALEAKLQGTGSNEVVEVIVTWDGQPNVAAAKAAAGPFKVIREFSIIDGFLASANPGQIRALAKVPGVQRIDDNFEVQANNHDTDIDFGTENARLDFGVDGTGVDVCVLDTGADPNHEQLDSQIIDFRDSINGLTTAYDDHGHGSHVAATIAGDGIGSPDASLYQGIAPGANLYISKVLNAQGSGTTAQIIDGIEWCVDKGVDIMSASLGGGASDGLDPLSQAVNNAVLNYQIVATIAAGNSGDGPESVGAPGAAEHAITVGAGSKFGAGLYLAPFSSRGPNLAGVMKPDVVSPGVAVVSADAGTVSGYVAGTGTSMATPFTAGAVALALDANPSLSPTDVKDLIAQTSRDAGPPGMDKDYGHGYIDGYGLVSAALGGTGSSPLPAHTHLSGSVPDNGLWTHSIEISGDDIGQPLGITILIDGQLECSFFFFGICFIYEWSPDLDARLIAPDGTVTDSRCALEGDCGSTGVQETFHVTSAQPGTYDLEIYPFSGDPNLGKGGPFDIDIFTGSAGGVAPPTNVSPTANAGPDQTVTDSDGVAGEDVTLDGSGSSDSDGTIVSYSWSEAGSEIATGVNPTLSLGDGVHTITLIVTDDDGAENSDDVVIAIDAPAPPNVPPMADAGPDQTVSDSNGAGGEDVTLDGLGSSDSDGTIVSYSWAEAGSEIASGVNPTLSLGDGVHTITLTITDDDGAENSDDVVITVEAPVGAPAVHIGDLDGSVTMLGKSRWQATVSVSVHDAGGSPVAGATVEFSLSTGSTTGCTTNGAGQCVVSSPSLKKRDSSVTFTVTGVNGAFSYDPSANHDPDGDSNGTAITLAQP